MVTVKELALDSGSAKAMVVVSEKGLASKLDRVLERATAADLDLAMEKMSEKGMEQAKAAPSEVLSGSRKELGSDQGSEPAKGWELDSHSEEASVTHSAKVLGRKRAVKMG